MPWIGPAVGIGASLIGGSGLFGGHHNSPLHDFRNYYGKMLYGNNGQGGFLNAFARDRQNWNNLYNNLIQEQSLQGKSELKGIKKWGENTKAADTQSLINRGLYNTTVADSEQQDIGAQQVDMRQAAKERNRAAIMGLQYGKQAQLQSGMDKSYDWQRLLATGPGGQLSDPYGRHPDNSGIGSLFGQLAGGVFGQGGPFSSGGGGGFGGGGSGFDPTFGQGPQPSNSYNNAMQYFSF